MVANLTGRKKAPTEEIIRDNAMGISLATIAYKYGICPSSVAQRLRQLGIQPADTRRAFMDGVLSSVSPEAFAWIRSTVTAQYPIRKLMVDALETLYRKNNPNAQNSNLCSESLSEPDDP